MLNHRMLIRRRGSALAVTLVLLVALGVATPVGASPRFGEWSLPVNLGPIVNSAAGEAGPTLFEQAGGDDEDANESGAVLIFNRDPGTGQDLYMSVRGRDGSFGVATAITELNTPFTDARATIRSDG